MLVSPRVRPHRPVVAGCLVASLGVAPVVWADREPWPTVVSPTRSASLASVYTSAAGAMSPSVSGDGRLVAHVAPTGDERGSTIVLRDRELEVSTDMLPWSSGDPAGGSSVPVLSDDGCTLTVITELPLDRFRDDDDGARWDVYQRRLRGCDGRGDWTLVSATRDGGATGNADPSVAPAVSADGSRVAYARRLTFGERTLLSDDVPVDATTVEVVDLDVPSTSAARAVVPSDDGEFVLASEPSLSLDGTVLATTAVAADGTDRHVMVWDLGQVGGASDGRRVGGATESWQPSLSGDGRRIAFVSESTSLVPDAVLPVCTLHCVAQVYVLDRATGEVILGSRVGRRADVVGGNGPSRRPVLDRTGDTLVYITRATNMFPLRHRSVGGATDGEVVRHLVGSTRVERISLAADGVRPTPAVHGHPAISSTGRVVAFDSAAPDLAGESVDRRISIVASTPTLRLSGVDMGESAVGFPGIERVLTVTNRGPVLFVPAAAELDGVDFTITSGTCVQEPVVPVLPGGSCTVGVTFFPGSPGPRSATLTVREDGPGAASVSAPLAGIGGEPRLQAEPVLFEAGTTVVGTNGAAATFFVQPVTGRPTRIESVLLEGDSIFDFVIVTDECSGTRASAGEVCRLVVVFRPTAAGRRRASIVVSSSNGGRAVITMVGEGRYSPTARIIAGSRGVVDGRHRVVSPSRLTVAGAGYAPDTEVTVGWGDGFGRPVTVTTDAQGAFVASFVVFPGERLGRRGLVAAAPGLVSVIPVLVVSGLR